MTAYIYRDFNQYKLAIAFVSDDDAISQVVDNIIRTSKYTRPFKNGFGANLEDEVFDFSDYYAAEDILARINKHVGVEYPLVYLDMSTSQIISYPDDYVYDLYLDFKVIGDVEGKIFKYRKRLKAKQ